MKSTTHKISNSSTQNAAKVRSLASNSTEHSMSSREIEGTWKQSHRAVQRLPPEAQTGIAVALQLLTLAAAVVTVELKATLIIALHKHHAIGRAAFRRGCSYAHCIGLRDLF